MRHNIRDHSTASGAHAEGNGTKSANTAALTMLGIEKRDDTPPHVDGHGLATTSEDVPFKAEDDAATGPLPTERNWWCLLTSNPFENVFTPVRLNRAADRCVYVRV